jgi:hypothetical protein
MSKYHEPLYPNQTYHLFNRAVGNERLFISHDNYRYFILKMQEYILPVADLFTYSLIPNHFHLLIRIKDESSLIPYFEFKKQRNFHPAVDFLPEFVMQQFSNWCNGYAKAFNKMYNRKGSLFIDYLKRSPVTKETDLFNFLFYVNNNACKHGLCRKIGDWSYDGYKILLHDHETFLKRDEVISWFGSKERFIKFHEGG